MWSCEERPRERYVRDGPGRIGDNIVNAPSIIDSTLRSTLNVLIKLTPSLSKLDSEFNASSQNIQSSQFQD
jgi:hypothetical protein